MPRPILIEIRGDASDGVQAARQADRAYTGLGRSLDGADRSARRSSGGLGGLAGGLSRVAGAGAIAATATAGAGVGLFRLASAGSDAAEATSAAAQVFGTGFKAIEDGARNAATQVGLSRTEYLTAAKDFGTYGAAAGLAGNDLAGFSTEMIALAADLASFNNTDVPTAIAAIGSGLRGEAEPLRQFGILLDDATLRQEALKQGLISSTKDALTPQQKVLAANAAILGQAGAAQGDFTRTAGGMANQTRIASAQLKDQAAALGTSLVPAGTKALTWLNNMIPRLSTFATEIGTRAKPFIDAAKSALDRIQGAWENNSGSINKLMPALKIFGGYIGFQLLVLIRGLGFALEAIITIAGRVGDAFDRALGAARRGASAIRDAAASVSGILPGFSAGPVLATAGGQGQRGMLTGAVGTPGTGTAALAGVLSGRGGVYVDRRTTSIRVDGALDPVAVAEQIGGILTAQQTRMGREVVFS